MLTNDDRHSVPSSGMYRVVGVGTDGARELCAAAVSREIAETVAALEPQNPELFGSPDRA